MGSRGAWIAAGVFTVAWVLAYGLCVATNGAILGELAELKELFWVTIAATFGVSVSLWSVITGLFTMLEECRGGALTEEDADATSRGIQAISREVAVNGRFAAVLLLGSVLLGLSQSVDPRLVGFPDLVLALTPYWISQSARIAALVLGATILIDLFGAMRNLGEFHATLTKAIGRKKKAPPAPPSAQA